MLPVICEAGLFEHGPNLLQQRLALREYFGVWNVELYARSPFRVIRVQYERVGPPKVKCQVFAPAESPSRPKHVKVYAAFKVQ